MKKIFLICASISVLIIALSVAYYLVILVPNSEKTRLELETARQELEEQKNAQQETKTEFDACYEQCLELGMLPVNGECPKESYLSKRRKVTDFHPEVKEGEPWCYVRGSYCLTMCGPKKESTSPSQSSGQAPVYDVVEPVEIKTESLFDKFERERQQECQKKINDYNICMHEYNAKMAEYNECLNESNDPNSWRYGLSGFCYKPMKLCFKPICAY